MVVLQVFSCWSLYLIGFCLNPRKVCLFFITVETPCALGWWPVSKTTKPDTGRSGKDRFQPVITVTVGKSPVCPELHLDLCRGDWAS